MSRDETMNEKSLRALTDFRVWLRRATDSMLAKYAQEIEPMITEFIETEIHDIVRIALNNSRELYVHEMADIASWIGDLSFCEGMLIVEAAWMLDKGESLKARKARLISELLGELSVRLQIKMWNLEHKVMESIKVV